ncbi:RNA polymerase sigma factor [Streptomyces violascens]|uniref:RNA polymerase sigma factor n=1 Tax=Streptomyces violascens TaxID=67381 RepID=UPI0036B5ECFC
MTEAASASTAPLADLYAVCGQEMMAVARRLLAEQGVPDSVLGAEDVVHEAFAKALRAPAGIREPRAYVYAVIRCDVRGAALAYRARRAQQTVSETEQASPEPVQSADFSELVANRMAVQQALGLLPVQQRTAVWATKALDYTQDECAVVMQKRPGTVATHVARGMCTLRVNLIASVAAVLLATTLALWVYRGTGLQTAANGGERSGTGLRMWHMVNWGSYAAVIIAGLILFRTVRRAGEIRRRRRRRRRTTRFRPVWSGRRRQGWPVTPPGPVLPRLSDKALALVVDAAELVISEQRVSTDLLSQWLPVSASIVSELMGALAQLRVIEVGSGRRSRVLVPLVMRDATVASINSLREVARAAEPLR